MRVLWACGFLLLLAGCATAPRTVVAPPPCAEVGLASWYRVAGHRAADGERPRAGALLAAHRSLPFGTLVRVTDVASGRSVVVRIGDRGPFVPGRIIDLSLEAARVLGIRRDGVASVRLELADPSGGCPFEPRDGQT